MNSVYEAPKSALENKPGEGVKLYKISGVGVATFFGSTLAGGIIMAINFRRLGDHAAATRTLLLSFVASILLFSLLFLIPESVNIPGSAITIPQIIAMVQIAKRYQLEDIDHHINKGGELSSNWKAFAIGLLTILPILVVVFALAFIFE